MPTQTREIPDADWLRRYLDRGGRHLPRPRDFDRVSLMIWSLEMPAEDWVRIKAAHRAWRSYHRRKAVRSAANTVVARHHLSRTADEWGAWLTGDYLSDELQDALLTYCEAHDVGKATPQQVIAEALRIAAKQPEER